MRGHAISKVTALFPRGMRCEQGPAIALEERPFLQIAIWASAAERQMVIESGVGRAHHVVRTPMISERFRHQRPF